MRESIAIYSLWRDSEPHIHRTLSQFEDLELLNYDFEYYFYENDSKDNTVEILQKWLKDRNAKFLTEKLNAPKFGSVEDVERMEMLCGFRNKCKSLLSTSNSKYTLLVDSDIKFNNLNLIRHLANFSKLENCAFLTPNVRQNIPDYVFGKTYDSYYDTYPFRDIQGLPAVIFSDCPFSNGIDIMNWNMKKPIKCKSSFGGFALIETETLKKVKWSTTGECDHVEFCNEVRQYGDIYIDPTNLVFTDIDLSDISTTHCLRIASFLKKQLM
jgi:hypothetical protein